MPNISVPLYDDSGSVVVMTITVTCTEAEAQYLERLLEHTKFHASRMPQSIGHNITFRQFKQHFEHHRKLTAKYIIST